MNLLDILPTAPTVRVRIDQARGPCVYICWRGVTPLYVGHSCSFLRPMTPSHKYLKRARAGDEMMVWPCPSIAEARRLELLLIEHLKPEWNPGDGPWWKIKAGLRRPTTGWREDSKLRRALGSRAVE